jgi:hypothetical protein
LTSIRGNEEKPAMSEKRRRTRIQDKAVAYHEAGHAIAAWHIKGLRAVGRISIEPDEDYAGEAVSKWLLKGADPEFNMTARTRLCIENEIMGFLAGGVAQRMFNKRSVRHYHSSSDHREAIDLASYVAGSGRGLQAFLHWLWVCAEDLAKVHWPMIEDLAEELLQRRKIAGKDLRQWLVQWHDDESNRARESRWRARLRREEEKRRRLRLKGVREQQKLSPAG